MLASKNLEASLLAFINSGAIKCIAIAVTHCMHANTYFAYIKYENVLQYSRPIIS